MRLASLCVAVCLSGCVVSPFHDSYQNPDTNIRLNGYASVPDAEVTIQARNKMTGEWVTLTSTTAFGPHFFWGGVDLYGWSTGVTMHNVDHWQCYYDASCTTNQDTRYDMTLRVLEENSTMWTYDEDSYACTTAGVNGGLNVGQAAYDCRIANTSEVVVYYDQIN